MPNSTLTVGKGVTRGPAAPLKYYPVAAAQTFVVGDWVYLSSGELVIAAAEDAAVGNVTLAGRAGANAADVLAGTAGSLHNNVWHCPVEPPDNLEYRFQVYHSTLASATIANSEIGLTLPLRNQDNQWVLNKEADNTNDRFTIVERESAAADTYPFVWARAIESGILGA